MTGAGGSSAPLGHPWWVRLRAVLATGLVPQGPLTVVQEIPAGVSGSGGVVAVDREDARSIARRVASVSELQDAQRQITMNDDANDSAGPALYTVAEMDGACAELLALMPRS